MKEFSIQCFIINFQFTILNKIEVKLVIIHFRLNAVIIAIAHISLIIVIKTFLIIILVMVVIDNCTIRFIIHCSNQNQFIEN